MKIYLNKELVDKKDAKVSVFDHGYLYGDGVFEGIRVYGKLIFKLKEHIDRLYESAHTLMLKIPMTKAEMTKAVIKTLQANKLKDAYIRLIVSRGEGDLGLDPRKCKDKGTVVIIADKINLYPKELYQKGMSIITVPTLRNVPEALNAQIKSLNYLNNILAKIEATNRGYQEALMLNNFGFVAECTGDNIFLIRDGKLITPPSSMGILKGVTRDSVIAMAKKMKIAVCEDIFTRHEIYNSDECFLTGTAAEIIPVVKVDERLIGSGKPGGITKRIMTEFKKLTKTDGVRYQL